MKVELIQHTNTYPEMLGRIAGICRGNETDSLRRYMHCLKYGHHSILRHAFFTFRIEGVTKRMTHQLVRHKFLDVTQRSSNYYPDNDVNTALYVSGNLQAWREFLEQRLCKYAHPEIKSVAEEIFKIIYSIDPHYLAYMKGNKGRCERCKKCLIQSKVSDII